jgi:hypothetical protein
MNQTNFKEHNKLRIRNCDPTFIKHEITKLVIMILSNQKHKKCNVYSEVKLPNGDIVDVKVETPEGDVYYEVQKEMSPQWEEDIKKRDLDLNIDTMVIGISNYPDNIDELIKQLEKAIV